MEPELPYLVAPRRFPELLSRLQSAAVPERVTFEFIKKLGFASSNDRAFISLLKRLGFLDQNGQPTERYRAYRHKQNSKRVLADGIREAYAPVFALHTDAHSESEDTVKDVISSVSGREPRYVSMIAATFSLLCQNADFTPEPAMKNEPTREVPRETTREESARGDAFFQEQPATQKELSFHYNIQIHLPATTDISVYNAIFKSLRQNLFPK